MNHYCPYCYKDMPSGYEAATWACCGEVGHALACNKGEKQCSADTSEDDNGEMCQRCIKEWQDDFRYYKRLWDAATLEERDPEAYRQSLIDAGRGHLVKER